MKYMTPELLARIRSEDDTISEAAADEWDQRGEEYRAHLQQLQLGRDLPRGVRRLLKVDTLHDAKVLSLAADEGNGLSISLELPHEANPGKKHLELLYKLAGGPSKGIDFIRHPSLNGDGNPLGWWLYDEVGVTDGPVEAFTHSILFTGGWELRLTFFTLAWRRLEFLLLPTTSEGVVDPKEVERWETARRAANLSRVTTR
jgi:hypothetical protein